MLFSYYFDSEKTHLLNCRFQVLQFTEKAAGIIEIMFSAEIAEHKNGSRLKRETKVATFSFPPTAEGQTKHDIDFTRVRVGDEKKWIFTVINNKDGNQNVTVGLISSSANKNPLGMDIYHDDEEFNAELKANNLSILEQGYVAPLLTQTMVNAQFPQAGYPERFGSFSATYDSVYQLYKVTDFTQDFLEPIPAECSFKIQLDLAPVLDNLQEGNIFNLNMPNLGRIGLMKDGVEYMLHNGGPEDVVRTQLSSLVQSTDFWNHGMTSKAKMTIEGDGKGSLSVTYLDTTFHGIYDQHLSFNRLEFNGTLTKLDNIAVVYQK